MDEKHQEQLKRDVIGTIRSGAMKLTGIKRRRFLAEIALKYCNGNPRVTEQRFGFSRAAAETGLGEQRSGLRCVDAFRLRGRKKSEGQSPGLVEEIRQLVEPTAPKVQTTLAYTRITAEKVRGQLLQIDGVRQDVPCRQTIGTVLNRLGYRRRSVLKTKPQKKCRRPTPSSRRSRRRVNEQRLIRSV